jgi:membrane protein YqaA with SNARE-associated domain
VGHVVIYAGLFAAALAAATVLPVQSEVALVALLLAEHYPVWTLVLVASLGNTLGSSINWGLGRLHRPHALSSSSPGSWKERLLDDP